MTKQEILSELEAIASTQGFLYSLAAMLRDDLFIDPADAADIDWHKKLSFQEFTLLLGLMVKHPISLELPTPDQMQKDVKRVYSLFKELHQTHTEVFIKRIKQQLKTNAQENPTEENRGRELKEFFGSGEMMLEPMFYGGSGAYDFQYLELAPKKYANDSVWIQLNKGLSIERAVAVAMKLKELEQERIHNSNEPANFEEFCKQILNIFRFTKEDIGIEADAQSFLDAFTLEPGKVNQNFVQIGQYNVVSSHPIVRLDDGSYFLPITFTLAQSIYESPFYWMGNDKAYEDTSFKNRGATTEDIAYELLTPVFGAGLLKNIRVQRNKGEDSTDIDILAVGGNKAIVFQAKSKKLTELARKGDTDKLKKDFVDAVQKAYEQGLVCRDAILSKGNKLVDAQGDEIKLEESIDEVYIVCLTSDDYLALTHQVDTYLKKGADQPFPIAMSLFDLDTVAFYLKDPFELLYYLRQRVATADYFTGSSEMAYLGYHLNQKLFRILNSDHVALDDGFAQLIDANFPVLRGHHRVTKAADRLHHKWKNARFNELIEQVKSTKDPGFTDAIFFLYDLSSDAADGLISEMNRTIAKCVADGRNHDFSMVYENGRSGVSFLAKVESPQILGRNLMDLAMARKYKTKADEWLALGSVAGSGRMIDALGFSKQPWKYDATLEEFQKVLLKTGIPIGKDGKELGRNEPCYCGSGKKYKKCCGAN